MLSNYEPYFEDLENCQLCEWRCGVNRLRGEQGVCKLTLPAVASATLHPAPPESYTVFMAGCNYKCLSCQNWSISQFPDNGCRIRGYIPPEIMAQECIANLRSSQAQLMRADRIFFSGGEPTPHLPFIEKVVKEAKKLSARCKINYDTNGFLTEKSLERVLSFTTSITYDLKAYHNEVHQTLTGAPVKPVLRNARIIATQAPKKLWEYRILVIPHINEEQVKPLCEFIASISPSLPVCFLAFRPNFVLENHPGSTADLMKNCVDIAKRAGLRKVSWSGVAGGQGSLLPSRRQLEERYRSREARQVASYALMAGCVSYLRDCGKCRANQMCSIKGYIPQRVT